MSYEPLLPTKDEIRLLQLEPSQDETSPIVCSLVTVSLHDPPPFDSLSYAWGHAPPRVLLQVHGSALKITPNLEHAIRAVRRRDRAALVWIDAICIDQGNLAERNHQVRLMRRIYTRARAVSVWLGEGYHGVEAAFAMLEALAAGTSLLTQLGRHADRWAPWRVQVLTEVFEYAWWKRLWVIQEALLAAEAVVYCGSSRIGFRTVLRAFEAFWNEYMSDGHRLRQVAGAANVHALVRQLEITVRRLHVIHNLVFTHDEAGARRFRDSTANLPFLLHSCSWSEVSDPRDKIYGALGLFSVPFLEPDYGSSVAQVFGASTFGIVRQADSLALLSQIGTRRRRNDHGIPSWSPDWTEPSVSSAHFLVFHGLYGAGKNVPLDVQLVDVDERTISVAAQVITDVIDVAAVYDHQDCTLSASLPGILRPVLMDWKNFFARTVINKSLPAASIDPSRQSVRRKKGSMTNATSLPAHAPAFMPAQSQSAPLYMDSNYRVGSNGGSQSRHATEPKPSLAFVDAISRSLYSQLSRNGDGVQDAVVPMQLQQSYRAPIYQDADYPQSGLPHRSIQSVGVPTCDTDSRMPTVTSAPPLPSTSTGKTPLSANKAPKSSPQFEANDNVPYKTYDSFSHTYVDEISRDDGLSSAGKPLHNSQNSKETRPLVSDAFWRTLCMDVIDSSLLKKHRRCEPSDQPRFDEWLQWITGPAVHQGIPQLHWHLNTILQAKRLIATRTGGIGLASEHVRPGDKICVLAGESYPYVVRPVADSSVGRRYTLVCPCYVFGIMDGEAVSDGGQGFEKIYLV